MKKKLNSWRIMKRSKVHKGVPRNSLSVSRWNCSSAHIGLQTIRILKVGILELNNPTQSEARKGFSNTITRHACPARGYYDNVTNTRYWKPQIYELGLRCTWQSVGENNSHSWQSVGKNNSHSWQSVARIIPTHDNTFSKTPEHTESPKSMISRHLCRPSWRIIYS